MQLVTNKPSAMNPSEEITEPISKGRRDPTSSTDTAAHGRECFSEDTDLSCTLQESAGCQGIFNVRVGTSWKPLWESFERNHFVNWYLWQLFSPRICARWYTRGISSAALYHCPVTKHTFRLLAAKERHPEHLETYVLLAMSADVHCLDLHVQIMCTITEIGLEGNQCSSQLQEWARVTFKNTGQFSCFS